jgi:UDPglucose 6-dehydrogenase
MLRSVVIIGAGVVGTATGNALSSLGHDVQFVDVSAERRAALRRQGLSVSSTVELPPDRECIIFLALPTPATSDGYDLTWLKSGAFAVGAALASSAVPHTVVLRSTVSPGVCRGLLTEWLEESSGRSVDEGFRVASVPEFLRERHASSDALAPWVSVVGASNPSVQRELTELLEPLGGALYVFDDATTAEAVKIMHNCFNATKISFWNEMWLLCERLGLDQSDIGSVVAVSSEASFNPTYGTQGGFPFGGSCLPKDLDGLIGFADAIEVATPLIRAVRDVNQRVAELSVQLISPDTKLALA